MTAIYDVLRQDFAAAKAAFGNSDFHDMNICANRLMSNVVFGEESDKKYMVPGYFLRIVANDFLALQDEAVSKTIRPVAEYFVTAIDRGFKEDVRFDSYLEWVFRLYRKKTRTSYECSRKEGI
jgi:hypothetical protein